MFPTNSVKSIELVKKVFAAIPESGIKPIELRRKLGIRDQRTLTPALSLLVYLGKVERKGIGKNITYYRKADSLDIERDLIKSEEPSKAFYYVLAKRKKRVDVAEWVYGNKSSTSLKRVSSMMKVGKLLGLIVTAGGYKVSKDRALDVFESLVERIYFKYLKETGNDLLDMGTLFEEIKKFVPDMEKKAFDELMLSLKSSRKDLELIPAPAVDDDIRNKGIDVGNRVYYHLRFKESRWGFK